MKAFSIDLRTRVLDACDAGQPTRKVALRFKVSESWVRRVKQVRREEGRVEPLPQVRPRTCKLAPYYEFIRELITAQPDLTLEEIRGKLAVVVSMGTLWKAVRDLDLSVKKNVPGSRTRPPRRPEET